MYWRNRVQIDLLFEPRDLWFGVYWDVRGWDLFVYVCLLPTFPVRLIIQDVGKERV